MNIKQSLNDFVIIFAISLVTLVVVTLLWNILFHASALVDWETSLRSAIVFGIVLSLIKARENTSARK